MYAPAWWVVVRNVGGKVRFVALIFWEAWDEGCRRRTGLGGQVRAPDLRSRWCVVVRRDSRGNERIVIDREGSRARLQR
jgi:hypothetical protein